MSDKPKMTEINDPEFRDLASRLMSAALGRRQHTENNDDGTYTHTYLVGEPDDILDVAVIGDDS